MMSTTRKKADKTTEVVRISKNSDILRTSLACLVGRDPSLLRPHLVIKVDQHHCRYESHHEEAGPLVVVGDVDLVRPQIGHAYLESD